MKLIVGLGNPGEKYQGTRHNIGFHILNKLQKQLNLPDFQEDQKFKAHLSQGAINIESNQNTENKKLTPTRYSLPPNSPKILLAKPTTFMNLSGEAISKLANYYKIPAEDIIVIYDDIDLPLGKIRIRSEGGPGTHNGMKSTIQHIGPNFPRIRIGIESRGELTPKQIELHDFVLSKFTPQEQKALPNITKQATSAITTILEKGITEAMNHHN